MCVVTASTGSLATTPSHDEGLRKDNSSSKNASSDHHDEVDIVASFENVDCNEVWNFFMKTSVLSDFFNWRKPWVLVPQGSFMGYFDWVPLRFRYGPWHPACMAYLGVLTAWVYNEYTKGMAQEPFPNFQPMEAYTPSWYYNVAGFAWTSFIIYRIFCSGMGWTSWGMYTVWSWTFTALRHGLCAAVPFKPEWTNLSEQLRFPTLVQATLTFAVWNAAIGPSIYAQMKTPSQQASFCRFFGNSLWRQLHVYNILYAAINGIWGSPARALTKADFSVALAICLFYSYFYLVALDRMGVHYYLVFSPRTPFALVSWTILFACHYACFALWNTILTKYAV
ncbi:expressed unknown protein [Seminavis robusta]|uniref:Uncharacterized protein n=1 Tax=Seminavis robusta TaxID=568900 RepID=A0A9N8HY04_9STRA|nr:expressed unknown protein [Seminavis robusta]|eukprot:Sro1906_g304630.1 n/a (337) ;mRNA; f:12405-13415